MRQRVIGLVGETGSGKDTVADYLRDVYGAELTRFSDPLKSALALFFDAPSKADQAWLYGVFKERFGEDVLHQALRHHLERTTSPLVVINGLRMRADEDFVRSIEGSMILYITAPQRLRWERTVGRGEKSDDAQSFDAFAQFESTAETERHVPAIGSRAEETIVNDGTLQELLDAVDAVMQRYQCKKAEK